MKFKQELLTQPAGEMWKKIREELNENVNTRDQDLIAIKDWLKKQPHLPDEWGKDKYTVYYWAHVSTKKRDNTRGGQTFSFRARK